MGAEKERDAVRGMYPKSQRWAAKVNRMSDAQVVAIYLKSISSNSKKKEGDTNAASRKSQSSDLEF